MLSIFVRFSVCSLLFKYFDQANRHSTEPAVSARLSADQQGPQIPLELFKYGIRCTTGRHHRLCIMSLVRNGTYNIQSPLSQVCLALTSSDQSTPQIQDCSSGNSSQLQVRNKCVLVRTAHPQPCLHSGIYNNGVMAAIHSKITHTTRI